jgi:hypothetical protein
LLKRCDSGVPVVVKVFQPRKNDEPGAGTEWRCDFEIVGLDKPISSRVLGEDGMQALLLVFPAIKTKLKDAGIPVSWLSDAPWDVGIPSYVPHGDPDFEELIERLIGVENLRRYIDLKRSSES